MNISIFGGGIAGLTAAVYSIRKHPTAKIKIYTKDVGGNFEAGGLKYLKFTKYTKMFLAELGYDDCSVRAVNGGVLIDENIESFPLYMFAVFNTVRIQEQYWKKTGRNMKKFDPSCMNDAYDYRTELISDIDKTQFMEKMVKVINEFCEIEFVDFSVELFDEVCKSSDVVIYTLPLPLLDSKLSVKIKPNFTQSNLFIHRYELESLKGIWYDYLYVPQNDYRFHRLSFNNRTNTMDVEINGDANHLVDSDVLDFLLKHTDEKHFDKISVTNIKGQITEDVKWSVEKFLPKNVLLLGRFAEWNKRIVWSDVVETLYSIQKLV